MAQPSEEFNPTTLADWTRSDAFHNSYLLGNDKDLDYALDNSAARGLKNIAVSAAHGRLLTMMALLTGAKRVLEVGTLGGYSAICLARGIPQDGNVTTLEISPDAAKIAQENITNAGLSNKITVLTGPALDTIKTLNTEAPFDLVFVDADKQTYCAYFQSLKCLLRTGGLFIFDNVVQNGLVADPHWNSERVQGIRDLLAALKEDKDFMCTTIGMCGEKGYDGFLYAVKVK